MKHTTTCTPSNILNYLKKKNMEDVRHEILTGLTTQPKYILPKYFYDEKGSDLFEQITFLPEYYPTKTEKQILKNLISHIDFDFNNAAIVELGSGDASKISLIFSQLTDEILAELTYYPVDISYAAIQQSITDLSKHFKLKSITGLVLDFNTQFHLIPQNRKRLFLFLGSTIGNFDEKERHRFMENLYHEMQPGDHLLLGLDRVKEMAILEKAYNDSQGVTARFNKNILRVVNRILDTNFNPDDFEHKAFFNQKQNRIEMHLVAQKNIQMMIDKRLNISLKQAESIHTENSYKFTDADIEKLTRNSRLKIKQVFSDENKWFSVIYLVKTN